LQKLLLYVVCRGVETRIFMSLSETAVAIQNIVRASNSFGFALLQQLLKIQPTGNIVISPFSLSAALTMTANGAGGTTKQAIFQSLGLSGAPIPALNAAYSSLIQMYSSTSPSCLFNVSNSLWLSSAHTLDPAFSQQIAPRYFADVKNIDFKAPAGATELNLWLAQRTNGKISDAVRTIDPTTAAVLINAAYFKASWQNKFHEQQTTPGTFAQSTGPVTVPMMTQSNRFGYCPAEQFDAIALPYQGPVRMSLVVPNTPDLPLDALAAGISMEIWEQIRDYLASQLQYGQITIPKFAVKSYLSLKDGLANAGLAPMFDPGSADFTSLTPTKPGYLSRVEHAACLSMDEHGTEAAPSMVPVSSPAAIEFDLKVNKPFLLAIEDAQTGAFLFLAVIRNVVEVPGQRTAGDTGQLQQQQLAQSTAPPNGAGSAPSPQLVEFDHSDATSELPAFADEQTPASVHHVSVQATQSAQQGMPQPGGASMLTEPHAKPGAFGQRAGDWLDDVAEDQLETAAGIPSLASFIAQNSQPAPQPSSAPLPQAAQQPQATGAAGAFQAGASGAFQSSAPAGAFQAGTPDAFPQAGAASPQAGAASQQSSSIVEQIQPSSIDIDDSNWAPQGGWGEDEQSSDWMAANESSKSGAGVAPGSDFSSPGAQASLRAAANASSPAPGAPSDDWAAPSTADATAGGWAAPSKQDATGGDWSSPSQGEDWAAPAKEPDWAALQAPAPLQVNPDWATPQQSALDQSSGSGNWKKASSEVPNPPIMDRSPLPPAKSAPAGFDAPKEPGYDRAALNAIGSPGKPTGGFDPSHLDAMRTPKAEEAEAPKPPIADLNSIPTPKPSAQQLRLGVSGEWSKVASSSAEGEQLVQGFTTKSDPSVARERRNSLRSLRGGGSQMGGRGGSATDERPSEGFMAAIMNFFGKMFGRKD
jgi:serpin B